MENENIELITRDPKKAIIKLSIPIFITLIISFVYNLIDTVWVAGLGPSALSAIAFVTPIYMLLISIGSGIGAGASSLISISIGAEDHKRANKIGLHALLLGGVLSIIPALLVLFYLKPILIFVGKEMFLVMQWIIVISYFYSYLPLYSQILNHLSLEPKVMQKEQHGQYF